VQTIDQLEKLYGASGSRELLNLFGSYFFFRNPHPDTTRWISQMLGEAESTEAIESTSYGAHAYRDGISIAPQTRIMPLIMPSEITSLPNLNCFVKYPGDLPITKLEMKYKKVPIVAEGFVEKRTVPHQ
jgi:type IV secretory pathway TraG/TraD family ATPase VirD4